MFFYVFTETDLVPDAKPPVAKPPISVPRKCPQNEVLKSRFSCPPDTCDTIYLSFLCIANQTETVMCTCKDGYLRTNSTGVCVPVDRCLPRKYNLSFSASATSLILKGTHHVGQFKSKVYPSLGQENLNYQQVLNFLGSSIHPIKAAGKFSSNSFHFHWAYFIF